MLLKAIQGVLAAFLGVQSRAAFEADLASKRPGLYIALGLAFTLLFVLSIAAVVHWVLLPL